MKKYLSIFILGLMFFITTSLFSYSEICCMFSSSRYYGWPYPYLSLQKTVETFAEANRVKTDSIVALTKAGWQFRFSGDMLRTSPFGIGGNLVFDLLVSFILAGVIYWFGRKIFSYFHFN